MALASGDGRGAGALLHVLLLLLLPRVAAASLGDDPSPAGCGVGCQMAATLAAFLLLTAAICAHKCCLERSDDGAEPEGDGPAIHPMLAGRPEAFSLSPEVVDSKALLDSVFRRAGDPMGDGVVAALPDGEWRGDGTMAGDPEEGTVWVTPMRGYGAQVPFRVEVLGTDPCGRWVSRDGVCCAGAAGVAYAFRKTYISGWLAHQPVAFVYEGLARHSAPSVVSGHIGINRLPHTGDLPPDGAFTFWFAKTAHHPLLKRDAKPRPADGGTTQAEPPSPGPSAPILSPCDATSTSAAPGRRASATALSNTYGTLPSPPSPEPPPELFLPTPPSHPEPGPAPPPALPQPSPHRDPGPDLLFAPDAGTELQFLPTPPHPPPHPHPADAPPPWP